MSAPSKPVLLLLALWFGMVGWLVAKELGIGSDRARVELPQLHAEFESLPVFPRAVASSGISSTEKLGHSGVSRQYQTGDSFDAVVYFYRQALRERGWVFVESKAVGGRTDSAAFCKGPIKLTVGRAKGRDSDHKYGLAVWWQMSSIGPFYCE